MNGMRLDSEFLRQPDFRFVVDFFEAREAGKRKPVDGDRADFANGRIFNRRTTAFFMDQDEHGYPSGCTDDEPTKPFDRFRTTQAMVARDQIQFNGKRGITSQQVLDKLAAALGQDHGIL